MCQEVFNSPTVIGQALPQTGLALFVAGDVGGFLKHFEYREHGVSGIHPPIIASVALSWRSLSAFDRLDPVLTEPTDVQFSRRCRGQQKIRDGKLPLDGKAKGLCNQYRPMAAIKRPAL
jgi:hypothetical protein